MAKEQKTEEAKTEPQSLHPKIEYNRRLWNKGKRVIYIPKNGRPSDTDSVAFKPEIMLHATDEEATRLLRSFRGEVIDMDNVTAESLVSGTATGPREDELIENRKKEAAKMKAERLYTEALKEGYNEDEARYIAGLPPLKEMLKETAA